MQIKQTCREGKQANSNKTFYLNLWMENIRCIMGEGKGKGMGKCKGEGKGKREGKSKGKGKRKGKGKDKGKGYREC